jgi:DNA-binding PadR family transcriptional regulator
MQTTMVATDDCHTGRSQRRIGWLHTVLRKLRLAPGLPTALIGREEEAMTEPEFEVDDAIVLLLGSDPGAREQHGEIRGVTRLEKLVFLLERETSVGDVMTEESDFSAYNFGPFSQKVYQAITTLSAAGLVRDSAENSSSSEDQYEVSQAVGADAAPAQYSTRDFELTDLGRKYFQALAEELPKKVISDAEALRRKFAGWPLRQLVRYVYERYDEYTVNSIIRDDILGGR